MWVMDLNEKVESPCKQTGEWGFVGYVQDKRGPERAIAIGVHGCYGDGRAQANAWMSSTPNAVRWEAQRLYVAMSDGTVMTPERVEA